MPSIFTRVRTNSTKNLPKAQPLSPNVGSPGIDEFGRVQSRGPPATPSKDKVRDGEKDKRVRAQTTSGRRRATNESATEFEFEQGQDVEDGFFPTSLESPMEQQEQEYGYLSHEAHVVLALEDVQRVVEVVAEELAARGLTTPFLFSNTALDLDSPAVRRLIISFLRAHDFREEARFAGPHALGALLRWSLARPVRVVSGIEQRGLIPWETYLRWRQLEHASNFSKNEFTTFVNLLYPPLRSLLLTLLGLLTRLLAHSTSSGLTPPTLASLFGPLLFGLPVASFYATYSAYLRTTHAAEHLLLSYVRLQVAQAPPTAPPPRRLLSWVQGYPATLAPLDSFERPRLGAKTRRVASVRRNVRMYTADLVRTCASWGRGPEGYNVRASKEWGRIAPEKSNGDRLEPRYSDTYRKKLDLPPGFRPQTSPFPSVATSSLSTPSLSTASSTTSTKSSLFEDPAEEAKFRSLTDMKWGEFSMLGFGEGSAAPTALQFDLTESARNQRGSKRATLSWSDFSDAGFSRGESSLSQTLQFAPPLSQTVQQWPAQKEDIHRKLKKNVQKALPPFGWDTAPVLDGREDTIEEGFLDVFCDLLYGGGWVDRTETTFRECNWALVEFRSLPTTRAEAAAAAVSASLSLSTSSDSSHHQDPRTSTTLLLFEEFVPAEYRTSLINQGSKPALRKRLPSFLSPKKDKKQWRPAATLNGRPYVVGTVPRSPSAREAEFERLLSGGGGAVTKVLTLDAGGSGAGGRAQTPVQGEAVPKRSISTTVASDTSASNLGTIIAPSSQAPPVPSKVNDSPSAPRTVSPFSPVSLRKARFRFPVGRENKGIIPSEYDTIDFDTRLASYSDEDLNNSSSAESGSPGKHAGPAGDHAKLGVKEKRMSKDDAWVDILVAGVGKRMINQDADIHPRGTASKTLGVTTGIGKGNGAAVGSGGHSDPELASKEVAQALASVRQHPPTDDDGDGNWTIRHELERQVELREPTSEMLEHRGNFGNGYRDHEQISVDDEQEESELPKRRLGYFDLHPDRRPLDQQTTSSSLAYMQDNVNLEPRSSASMYADSMLETVYSDGDFEPTSISLDGDRQPDGDIEVPAFVETDRLGRESDYTKTDSAILPSSLGINTQAQAPSKTAALIEMYRERERQTDRSPVRDRDAVPNPPMIPSTAPLQPTPKSRLPVRASSLLKNDLEEPTVAKGLVSSQEHSQSPSPEPEELLGLDPTAPVPFVDGDVGRGSPLRYVHGAPLHNVLEEGEEEE
ncbi:hypothetical protein DFH11DRAFT_1733630 [Phellopilus nigrolimitatus]|nr:hypothetical protein DFH11DRAFT_1733630 [Phellopilus nigrolimitatus]